MHVIFAPDCYTGTLTAGQAAEAMAAGWRTAAPHDRLTPLPLSDGGPGFLDVLSANLVGELHPVVTSDPLGRATPAAVFLTTHEGVPTAYIESAQAIGLHLLAPEERDPTRTSTAGLGALIRTAMDLGARRIVIGLGGSGTNDAGAGVLAALGGGSVATLGRGGLALGETTIEDLADLARAKDVLRGVELVVATDVDSPLLGLQGASATFAAQKGATEQQAQDLEFALGHFAAIVAKCSPPPTNLLTGQQLKPEKAAGAGAAGGLAYGLYLLGAHRVSGVQAVLEAVRFSDVLASADLVVTGEGSFDWQSLHGKVVVGVSAACQELAVPVIAIPGQSLVGRRDAMAAGLAGVYPVVESPTQLAGAMADPAGTLTQRTARVARTWSTSRR